MELPLWFWIIGTILTLLYTLSSIIFTVETFSSTEFLVRKFGEKNTKIMTERTWWAKTGYALSFYLGLIASVMILLYIPYAHWIALISLLGMTMQQLFWWTHPISRSSLKESNYIWAVITPLISFLLLGLALYLEKVS